MNKTIASAVIISLLAGCAVNPQVNADYSIVDVAKLPDVVQYQKDYAECAALANQSDVASNAVVGAGIGAVFGALLGAVIFGREGAAFGAGYGAILGGGQGAGGAVVNQQTTLRNCLSGRGYSIVR